MHSYDVYDTPTLIAKFMTSGSGFLDRDNMATQLKCTFIKFEDNFFCYFTVEGDKLIALIMNMESIIMKFTALV